MPNDPRASTLLQRVETELAALPEGLREHVERVRATAGALADAWRLTAEERATVDLAAAAHDLARHLAPEALLTEAERLRIPMAAAERYAPILLHGPIAAERLLHELGVTAPEVVEAVRYHTTGKPGMGRVARAVFLADKVEPWKLERRRELLSIHELAFREPQRAIAAFLTEETASLLKRGALVHPLAMETRTHYLVVSGQPLPPHPGAY